MAAHCGGGGIDDRARSGERERKKWSRDISNDIGLVCVWPVSRGDTRATGNDIEYSIVGSIDGRGMKKSSSGRQ